MKIVDLEGRGLPGRFGRYSDLFGQILALDGEQAIELSAQGEDAKLLQQRIIMAVRYHKLNNLLPAGGKIRVTVKGDKVFIFKVQKAGAGQ